VVSYLQAAVFPNAQYQRLFNRSQNFPEVVFVRNFCHLQRLLQVHIQLFPAKQVEGTPYIVGFIEDQLRLLLELRRSLTEFPAEHPPKHRAGDG
jgi:hypothetical protein